MRFLRSVAVGFVAAAAVCVMWVVGEVVFTAVQVLLLARSGSGGLGAVSVALTEPLLYIAPIAFGIGFIWRFRQRSIRRTG